MLYHSSESKKLFKALQLPPAKLNNSYSSFATSSQQTAELSLSVRFLIEDTNVDREVASRTVMRSHLHKRVKFNLTFDFLTAINFYKLRIAENCKKIIFVQSSSYSYTIFSVVLITSQQSFIVPARVHYLFSIEAGFRRISLI